MHLEGGPEITRRHLICGQRAFISSTTRRAGFIGGPSTKDNLEGGPFYRISLNHIQKYLANCSAFNPRRTTRMVEDYLYLVTFYLRILSA